MVRSSPHLPTDLNMLVHLSLLDGRGMIRPAAGGYWPARESLGWHKEDCITAVHDWFVRKMGA